MVTERTTKTSFSLEEYEIFLENPYMSRFSIPQLNQVISMHGFNKMYKRPKIELFDALSAIDLVKPYRSMLNDNDDYHGAYFQAGDFSLSSGEMKRDLEDLNWMECYIHATETVGPADSEKNGARNPGMTSDVSVPKDLLASMASPIIRRSRSQKRKRRCFDRAAGEDPAVVVGGDYFLGAQEPADATTVAAKVKAEEGSTSLYVDTYHWDL